MTSPGGGDVSGAAGIDGSSSYTGPATTRRTEAHEHDGTKKTEAVIAMDQGEGPLRQSPRLLGKRSGPM